MGLDQNKINYECPIGFLRVKKGHFWTNFPKGLGYLSKKIGFLIFQNIFYVLGHKVLIKPKMIYFNSARRDLSIGVNVKF